MIEGGPQRTLPPTPGPPRGGSSPASASSSGRGGARPPPRGRALPAPPGGGPSRTSNTGTRPQTQIYSAPTQPRAAQPLPTPPTTSQPGYMTGLTTPSSQNTGPTRASEPPRGRVMQRLSMFEQGSTNPPTEEPSTPIPSNARPDLPTPPQKPTVKSESSYGYGQDAGTSYGYGEDAGVSYDDDPSSGTSRETVEDAGVSYEYGSEEGASYGYGEEGGGALYEEDYGPSYPLPSATPTPVTPSTPGYHQGVTHVTPTPTLAPTPAKKKPPPMPPPKPQELQEAPLGGEVSRGGLGVRANESHPHPPPRSPRNEGSTRVIGRAPPLPWREEENGRDSRSPNPPPRSPDSKRRMPIGPSPPLPSREPLSSDLPMPMPMTPISMTSSISFVSAPTSPQTPPPSLSTPTSTPSPIKPARAKKEKAKGGGNRLSSFFRRSWYGSADAEQVAKADQERARQQQGDSEEEVLPTFGLTMTHLSMDGKQQADVLSSQMNEINDKIAALLQERRSQENNPHELARIDRQVRHYNHQLDVVSSELATVNQRISSQTQATPVTRVIPETDSPHLSRRPNVGALRGVRQEQRQAIVDFVTEHKLKLAYGRGDVIVVVEKFPTGWWKGELRGVMAYFQEKNTLPVESEDGDLPSSSSSSLSSSSIACDDDPPSSSSSSYSVSNAADLIGFSSSSSQAQATSFSSQATSPMPQSGGYSQQSSYAATTPVMPSQPLQPRQQQSQPQGANTSLSSSTPSSSSSSSSGGGAGPSQALALYSFEKQNATEVGMSKGETVNVVKVMDAWTYVNSSQGSGYVPTSYLKMQ